MAVDLATARKRTLAEYVVGLRSADSLTRQSRCSVITWIYRPGVPVNLFPVGLGIAHKADARFYTGSWMTPRSRIGEDILKSTTTIRRNSSLRREIVRIPR